MREMISIKLIPTESTRSMKKDLELLTRLISWIIMKLGPDYNDGESIGIDGYLAMEQESEYNLLIFCTNAGYRQRIYHILQQPEGEFVWRYIANEVIDLNRMEWLSKEEKKGLMEDGEEKEEEEEMVP